MQIIDARTLNSSNIGSDHKLILCRLRLKRARRKLQTREEEYKKLNIEILKTESTRDLYAKRLSEKININKIKEEDSVEAAWLRENITSITMKYAEKGQ